MDAYRCIVSKRDLRTYADRVIPRETLARILEAGRRSGSSRNRQPWQFIVVTDRDQLARLSRTGRFTTHLATAAVVVAVLVDATRDLFDAGRCAQNMMLAAWSFGVASCPTILQHDAEARAVLGVPTGPVIATAIAFGYPHPAGRGPIERLALRVLTGRGRKPLTDLVHWNRYGQRAV
ncbi:MAG: nitroreductase family protein [Armatimonadota bacterium]|nr:nitroreductase family protein [Armatimonadota bacterium]